MFGIKNFELTFQCQEMGIANAQSWIAGGGYV
jgi:hypothetical protein